MLTIISDIVSGFLRASERSDLSQVLIGLVFVPDSQSSSWNSLEGRSQQIISVNSKLLGAKMETASEPSASSGSVGPSQSCRITKLVLGTLSMVSSIVVLSLGGYSIQFADLATSVFICAAPMVRENAERQRAINIWITNGHRPLLPVSGNRSSS